MAELSLVIPYSAVGALLGSQAREVGAEGLQMMAGLRKIAVEVVAPDAAHGGGGGSSLGVEDGALEALAALINASSTTLVRLSLTARGHVTNLAPLFVALRPLPVLMHLALNIACDARAPLRSCGTCAFPERRQRTHLLRLRAEALLLPSAARTHSRRCAGRVVCARVPCALA